MGDDDYRSAVLKERSLEQFLCGIIKVVGGLVKDRRFDSERSIFSSPTPGFFSPRKDRYGLVYIFP